MGLTVFLDRDGVVNVDSHYVKRPEEFRFIDGSPEAVALLNSRGMDVILVTNQSIIGRGMASMADLERIFKKMTAGVAAAGGRFKDICFCPHTPDDGCDCRKPEPGMIWRAARRHGLDLSRSVMVGDSVKDIGCARNAGCARAILVATGNGETAYDTLCEAGTPPDHFAKDLLDAARWIIAEMGQAAPDRP